MNVAVKPAVECPELRAHQDEGLGYLSSLQESVQIIHHPGRQQHSSHTANWARRFIYSACRAHVSQYET